MACKVPRPISPESQVSATSQRRKEINRRSMPSRMANQALTSECAIAERQGLLCGGPNCMHFGDHQATFCFVRRLLQGCCSCLLWGLLLGRRRTAELSSCTRQTNSIQTFWLRQTVLRHILEICTSQTAATGPGFDSSPEGRASGLYRLKDGRGQLSA